MTVRQLADDVHWLSHCHSDGGHHLHFSEYILEGEDGYVLVDSGSSLFREEIIEKTNEVTDGAGPETVILSHCTLPHTENATALKAEWGDFDIITAVPTINGVDIFATAPEFSRIMGLSEARSTVLIGSQDIAGRMFTCMKPFLTDVNVSQWIFDHDSQILFTAEAFGHYHGSGECTLCSDEMEAGIDYSHVEAFYRDKLPFLNQLDLKKMRDAFELLFEEIEPAYVAPIHGNPVVRDDLDEYVDDVIRAMDVPTV